jgi:hypothetical protein
MNQEETHTIVKQWSHGDVETIEQEFVSSRNAGRYVARR